jgi:hypothetical protein
VVPEPAVDTAPFSWAGFAVGIGPPAALWGYLVHAAVGLSAGERANVAYLGFPALSGVLVHLIIGFGLLTDARTKPFGKGLLTGLAIGAWMFFLTCGVIATEAPRP